MSKLNTDYNTIVFKDYCTIVTIKISKFSIDQNLFLSDNYYNHIIKRMLCHWGDSKKRVSWAYFLKGFSDDKGGRVDIVSITTETLMRSYEHGWSLKLLKEKH